jgi:hypothetical protein
MGKTSKSKKKCGTIAALPRSPLPEGALVELKRSDASNGQMTPTQLLKQLAQAGSAYEALGGCNDETTLMRLKMAACVAHAHIGISEQYAGVLGAHSLRALLQQPSCADDSAVLFTMACGCLLRESSPLKLSNVLVNLGGLDPCIGWFMARVGAVISGQPYTGTEGAANPTWIVAQALHVRSRALSYSEICSKAFAAHGEWEGLELHVLQLVEESTVEGTAVFENRDLGDSSRLFLQNQPLQTSMNKKLLKSVSREQSVGVRLLQVVMRSIDAMATRLQLDKLGAHESGQLMQLAAMLCNCMNHGGTEREILSTAPAPAGTPAAAWAGAFCDSGVHTALFQMLSTDVHLDLGTQAWHVSLHAIMLMAQHSASTFSKQLDSLASLLFFVAVGRYGRAPEHRHMAFCIVGKIHAYLDGAGNLHQLADFVDVKNSMINDRMGKLNFTEVARHCCVVWCYATHVRSHCVCCTLSRTAR